MKHILLLFLQYIKVLLVVAFLKIYSVYARYKHFITHSQCQKHTHKYKQNKTGNTDTDYEHKNLKKQELPSES